MVFLLINQNIAHSYFALILFDFVLNHTDIEHREIIVGKLMVLFNEGFLEDFLLKLQHCIWVIF